MCCYPRMSVASTNLASTYAAGHTWCERSRTKILNVKFLTTLRLTPGKHGSQLCSLRPSHTHLHVSHAPHSPPRLSSSPSLTLTVITLTHPTHTPQHPTMVAVACGSTSPFVLIASASSSARWWLVCVLVVGVCQVGWSCHRLRHPPVHSHTHQPLAPHTPPPSNHYLARRLAARQSDRTARSPCAVWRSTHSGDITRMSLAHT